MNDQEMLLRLLKAVLEGVKEHGEVHEDTLADIEYVLNPQSDEQGMEDFGKDYWRLER